MRMNEQASVQRWLQLHCEQSPGQVAGGLVIASADADGAARNVAEWPVGGGMTPPLAAAAQAAAERSRAVLVAPTGAAAEATHNRVISLPLRVGERTLGAVALAVQADDGPAVSAMLEDLERASVDIGERLDTAPEHAHADAPAQAHPPGDPLATRVLALQETLLQPAALADGALAMLTTLAAWLGCDRVMLGAVEGHHVKLLALSNSAEFDAGQDLLMLACAAMQEAMDQGTPVVYPLAPSAKPCIVLAHAELHARGGSSLATQPLVHGGRAVGALLAQWRGAPPTDAALALLQGVAHRLGPWVVLSRRAERTWGARTADGLRAAGSRMTRPHDPLPKLLAGAALLGLVLATLLPVGYRVGAPARIEGAVQRVLAAPIDGYLHRSHVRPGDAVHAGDLLVELVDQDLQLEQRKWEAALAQHENGFAAALARADRAQFVIAQGKAGEARAQLELVRQQLARTRLLAPIDGIVIKGDLSQALGAPVQRGDALLTLAPADRYRLIVDVDERDIAAIQVGQAGHLALASLPGDSLSFVVERVTPVATVREGRNSFAVEARLAAAAATLRPGLEGVAKIDVGERSAAWIWGHRVWDWLRLALWSWGP